MSVYFNQYRAVEVDNSVMFPQRLTTDKKISISYNDDIKPLLEKRCIVCHACYDAPCQLKFSSTEGILRGANAEKVYNPRRLNSIGPSRLFIDGKTENDWREKGFHSVLNIDKRNLNKPLLQRILDLKKQNPQPDKGKLPADLTLDIEREQECPTQEKFENYAEKHPLWGMPYAMPNLNDNENQLLTAWLESGAATSKFNYSNDKAAAQINNWEKFLNQTSKKQRLTSRYLYEHVFHAHIHFDKTPLNEFYRLVRSRTPPGEVINEIATIRPYDNPGSATFYYRLLRYTPTIVAKNHIVYKLSNERMQRIKALFIEPNYDVIKLPSYEPQIASNPFKVYAAIPPDSRYRFLLDDARFFIEGFVKGPVCRGQIALNVIEDQFWIVFFNPDKKLFTSQASFLNSMSDYLKIPSERESHMNLLPIWTDYWQQQKIYMANKQRHFKQIGVHDLHYAMDYIWDGANNDINSTLTVFRHFDSATVEYGLIGKHPETMWIIDYPLMERIHYLLVAGFNIYGNVVHQLSTRIFMDFLRMEGENYFLAFLPVKKRKAIRDSWYQGMRSELDTFFTAPTDWLSTESTTGYKTDDVKSELIEHIKQRLGDVLQYAENTSRCGNKNCKNDVNDKTTTRRLESKLNVAMKKLNRIKGKQLHAFPEVSFVRIKTNNPELTFSYTLLRNKAYKNVTSLFSDERQRSLQDIENDTLTVVDWLIGNYPNFFFTLHIDEIDQFIKECTSINDQKSFDSFVEKFGVRRTSSTFWETADWFHKRYQKERPLHSGLYDLSRYSNL